ncbi:MULTISPECIES: hypothetical protein [unclassified Streptomyces]|uniref:hypothetical protein n=1 Tax=unclassified Streptomyces TaxID=2593676 RepID=UPI001BEC0410|nr:MULTISPECIES: hypothetical protein [unclassified Streptomyces]MBT2408297.1 hypothetical protein [Streptomyces sp. ISL-21]MBT2607327.1 hypothetical protein [Streptomyces sp. ISL-87]
MNKRLVLAGSAVVASLGLGLAAAPAMAQPARISVTCGDVTGLITAVQTANDNPEGGTITLAHRCAYSFGDDVADSGNALPAITGNVTIAGEDSTLIRSVPGGTPLFRILSVSAGGTLNLKGTTVTGGHTDGNGGGIANEGTLLLEHSTVAGNLAAGTGGGIANTGGTVTLLESDVRTNVVSGDPATGGGISNDAASTVTLKKAIVDGNTADLNGGGINNLGTLHVLDGSFITHNEARDGEGGGINNLGTADINGSKIIENWAGVEGGGINNGADATLTVQNSAFLANKSGRDGGGLNNEGAATLKKSKVTKNSAGRDGGGINNEQVAGEDAPQLTLEHTTVTENRAAEDGGGINNQAGGVVTLRESKIVKNEPTNCDGVVPGCSG